MLAVDGFGLCVVIRGLEGFIVLLDVDHGFQDAALEVDLDLACSGG